MKALGPVHLEVVRTPTAVRDWRDLWRSRRWRDLGRAVLGFRAGLLRRRFDLALDR